MKIEVNYWVMKQFLDCHEIAEVGIPSSGIVHPAFPLIILDQVDLLYQREIDPVICLADSFVCKNPSL